MGGLLDNGIGRMLANQAAWEKHKREGKSLLYGGSYGGPPAVPQDNGLLNPMKNYFQPVTNMFDPGFAEKQATDFRNTDMNPYTMEQDAQKDMYGAIRKPSMDNKDILMSGVEGGLGMLDVTDLGMMGAGVKGVTAAAKKAAAAHRKKWMGYPPGAQSYHGRAKLRKELERAALEAESQKHWYDLSGQGFLKATQGDLSRADHLANLSALTSSNTDVRGNMGFAATMYNQHQAGDHLRSGQFPNKMGNDAREYLKRGEEYIGPKRNPFFNNLMQALDPSVPQNDVTNDIWGARMYGYAKDSPGAAQHRVMTEETQRLAQKLGWKPHEVQAAYWSSIKARTEHVQDAVKAKGEALGWSDDKIRKEVRKAALKADMPEGAFDQAGYDFSDAMSDHRGYVGWEAVPSRKSGLIPEIHDAPYEHRMEFTRRMDEAIGDTIEKELGMLTVPGDNAMGTGFYMEDGAKSFNPSKQAAFVMPLGPGGQATGKIEASTVKRVELYAAIKGKLTHQDSVGYSRPYSPKNNEVANAFSLDFGRPISEQETEAIMDAMENHPSLQRLGDDGTLSPAVYFNPTDRGMIVYHDRYPAETLKSADSPWAMGYGKSQTIKHNQFQDAVKNIIQGDDFFPGVNITGGRLGSDGGLVGGQYGETYDAIIRRNGGEAQERTLQGVLTPKIEEIYRAFAKEKGYAEPIFPSTGFNSVVGSPPTQGGGLLTPHPGQEPPPGGLL